ncbi:hypothetical protein BU24DRAFT_424808 [Aaosphaeria arxii CBS 175.79]|uniref:Uncharacterized protein n=1 Tax=Aaosphaeria arxii CBS 175.79 TaxID=1450172 RepID=A0A6A5XKH7_9PLEO|nr:uncharacterized protein BU24DRAFT_424808 [Aaosphaeria arxii CBS 175.79]KAF2013788.1 hypothetical protein BU24DRAFT_424808 [Aaosphaeria arxii CBS 175.79]
MDRVLCALGTESKKNRPNLGSPLGPRECTCREETTNTRTGPTPEPEPEPKARARANANARLDWGGEMREERSERRMPESGVKDGGRNGRRREDLKNTIRRRKTKDEGEDEGALTRPKPKPSLPSPPPPL